MDDSQTVKELINTVAEKIGERHDMFTHACMQMYAYGVCLTQCLMQTDPIALPCVSYDVISPVTYVHTYFTVYKCLLLVALQSVSTVMYSTYNLYKLQSVLLPVQLLYVHTCVYVCCLCSRVRLCVCVRARVCV